MLSMQSLTKFVTVLALLLFSAPAQGQDSEPPETGYSVQLRDFLLCDSEEVFQCESNRLVLVDVNIAQLRAALEESEERARLLTRELNFTREQRTGAWVLAGSAAIAAAVLASILATVAIE